MGPNPVARVFTKNSTPRHRETDREKMMLIKTHVAREGHMKTIGDSRDISTSQGH